MNDRSEWVKRMKKVKRKLKVIYCIECAALKCTFQRGTERVTFQFRCSSFFASAQDVNVMNMLMLISWKGSTLLKTHPSCCKCKFMHISCDVCAACYLGKTFLLRISREKKKFFFCIIKTNNCEIQSERDNSQFLVRKQSIEMSQSPIHISSFMSAVSSSLKIYEFSHHNNFMVQRLCGDKLRYDWNLSFLSNLCSSSSSFKELKVGGKPRNLSTLFVAFRLNSLFSLSFQCECKKKTKQ